MVQTIAAFSHRIQCASWHLELSLNSVRRGIDGLKHVRPYWFVLEEYFCACGCSGRHTFDAIMQVFVWSVNTCFDGTWPLKRHDGSDFNSFTKAQLKTLGHSKSRQRSEKWRLPKRGVPLGFKAMLQQCRGDWMWYKELFSFPSWKATRICWKCEATQENYKNFKNNAPWRKNRLTPLRFFANMRSQGFEPSPLFSAIGFTLCMVMIDVLHCMDLGVSQDILGNIFWEAMPVVCSGRSHKAQVHELWGRIREYNEEFKPTTVLQGLTVEMVKTRGKAPKLRAKGAETRHLVPFGVLLAGELHKTLGTTRTESILKVATMLFDLYCLFAVRPVDHKAIADTCQRLCLMYATLGDGTDDTQASWRVKPKFHMMCELCEYQVETFGSPEEFWAYADESFVGFVAEFSERRGGGTFASTACENVLNRFKALAIAA